MASTIRDEVQQGETFTYTQDISHVADEFPFGFSGVTAIAEARDPRRAVVYSFPMQALSVGQKEITFRVPSDVTAGWIAGEWVVMQILINGGSNLTRVIEPTIHIKVREGFVAPRATGLGTGGFSSAFANQFNTGTSTAPQGGQ